jgi:hypothetical protein
VFTSPDYQLGYTNPIEITVGDNDWTFDLNGGLTFPDTTTQTTAYTGYHNGDMTGSVFADDSTLLVDGVNAIVPNSELAKSVTQVIDSNATVNTSATITTNNSYTNTVDFSTDVDPGVGYTLDGWYQRNSEQIEFALFGPGSFQTYLTGLALGRTVIVTYSTGSGNQTITRPLTQRFTETGQTDPANPTWGRVSGRIDATLPADQTGIVSINFPVYSVESHTWQFGEDGELTLPGGRTRIGTLLGSDAIIANEDTAFGVVTQGTNGSGVLLWIEDLENFGTSNLAAVYTNPANLGIVRIATGANGGPGPKFWDFNDSGALTFPQGTTIATADGTDAFIIDGAADKDVQIYTYSGATARGWTFGTDGSLTLPGDIKSNGNINIEVNLSDSTLRRWQFGEDGNLTVPGPINGLGNSKLDFTTYGANTAYLTTTSDDTTALIMGTTSAELYAHTNILIRTNTGGTAKVWNFNPDGSLTLPIGVSIDSSVDPLYPKIIADSGKLFSVQGQGSTGSAALAWSVNPNADTKYAAVGVNQGGGDNLAKVVMTAGNTTATLKVWKFDETGAFTFPDNTVQTTAWTGTTTGAITAETFNTDQITVVGNRISTTVTNANLELECNGTGGVVINTLAEATTASTARSAGYLGIPASAVSTTNTLTIADAGEHIYVTTNSQTITIPANASVAYPIGTTLTFIAGPSATTVSIAITSDTMYLAGTGTTGTRTLAAHGMATAVKVAATTWYINGTGLT